MLSSGVQTCADRKSTRLNSSHGSISYAVFCLKKKRGTRGPRPGPGSHAPRRAARVQEHAPAERSDYLRHRLHGARYLYLLALALGDRPDGAPLFGRMIREARSHFAAVIEEARTAGLRTGAMPFMLGK